MSPNNQTLCLRATVPCFGPLQYRHLDVVANHNTHTFDVSLEVSRGETITRSFRLPSEAADFVSTTFGVMGFDVSQDRIHSAIIDGLNAGGVA
jgi:hypothetical protein